MPVSMTVFGAVMFPVHREKVKIVAEEGVDRLVGVFFHGDDRLDAALFEALVQTGTHAGGDQHIDLGQGFGELVLAGMKALLHGQFDQLLASDAAFLDVVYPELAAFAGMLRDGLAVLTGNGDLHDFSCFCGVNRYGRAGSGATRRG